MPAFGVSFLEWLIALLAVLAVPPCLYLFIATLFSRRPAAPPAPSRRLRFDVVVPAHNEASVIERTVASIKEFDWPPDRFRLIVVADNCSDATAALARSAGARVLERRDPSERGKGYALAFAFRRFLDESWADAVVVIDADSTASRNLLEAFAAHLERGSLALQSRYGVLNVADSWRTRLMAIALACFHEVRSRARTHLGLSSGIRGNGWCIHREALLRVPYRAFSLAEDIEYGIELALCGIRVDSVEEASVRGEMVSGSEAAAKQRQRWEFGRFKLIATFTGPLIRAAIRNRSRVCLDLVLDLLVLPLSNIAATVVLLAAASGALSVVKGSISETLWLPAGCALALVVYVLRGWQLSGVGVQGLLDLARAPRFILWKLALLLRRRRPADWIRTDRGDQ